MRVFRPRLPRAVGAALAAAFVLSACTSTSKTDNAAAEADAGPPVRGGALTVAVNTEPTCFDIHVSPQDITASIQRNVFDSLISEDDQGNFTPWLATSWEAAPDLTSYTFKLRTDVKFTDGASFDAAAVKANFDHIAAKTTKSQYAASLLGPYTGTEVIDPATVKVSFAKPFAPFLQAASTAYLGFYSPQALAANADKLCAGGSNLVGSGPFKFASHTKGQDLVLANNPAYNWGPAGAKHQGAAYLDKLTYRFLPEDSVRVGAFASGQVDIAGSIPPVNVKGLEGRSDVRISRHDFAGAVYSLFLNTTRSPFDDERVRKAVQRGINIGPNVQSIYFDQYKRAWGPLGSATPGYDTSLENSWPYDPALANRLLDEAGWTARDGDGYRTKGGKRLTVTWPNAPAAVREQRDILAQAVQSDLKKVGVDVQRPALDLGAFTTNAYAGKYDVLDMSWARFEPDVLRLYFNSANLPSTGGQNAAWLKDPQIDEWTDAAAATLDRPTRDALYAKTQAWVVEHAAVVPLYSATTLFASGKQVAGLRLDPNAWPLFYDVWSTRR
ncbi:ABC transporter substrate-binding protein [Streptomyces sp. SID3343]|uniref:ABC transporter substrate-binding protein n=1 Tax=Streptomyces sp. SID3343 TaxID=2690260 RepID=UPI0013716DDF|nr:ABC transporter substrate-binding protein [Streptomyces sp. SID3343]MYW03300.1 ABC transporter substrate-binding protein [Streptomyces sp. SID3343]